ncbi:MAG: DUF4258 domain-containing protein [Chloroflexi bacterium]|nr:DUF4258 domain-containing protein [Chloroflexota bacterium]
MELEITQHAIDAMNERLIALEWVEDAVSEPELRTPDPADPELERFYRRIPPRDDRVLRVVVNTRFAPWRIVSVFFDRRMRRMV